MESEFVRCLNPSNDAFGSIAGEEFNVIRNGMLGPSGPWMAVSVDDLAATMAVAPGGLRGDNTVNIFVSKNVMAVSGIKDGAVLFIRGKRVRINSINDDGDNVVMLACTSAGVSF